MDFRYRMPVQVIFKKGALDDIVQCVRGNAVLIVCDPFFMQCGLAERVGASLDGKTVAYYSDITPNPTCDSVDAAARQARAINAGCVIGIGGGSALDVCKMTACLVENEGSIYDYYAGGSRTLNGRRAQIICVPTTAGTGSEVTNVGVYTNPKTGVKMPMVTDDFWADVALLDPELTYSLPAGVTAACGLDAFCHAIEAYWNKTSQPLCDVVAVDAMRRVLANLETACSRPGDETAREEMMLASLQAGVAFSQTRTTGAHAMSFSLTSDFGLSHGAACAITLPAFIRVSGEKQAGKMQLLVQALGFADIEALADGVQALMERVGLPTRLSKVGVGEADIPALATAGLSQGIIQLTPATMNQQTAEALLRSIL